MFFCTYFEDHVLYSYCGAVRMHTFEPDNYLNEVHSCIIDYLSYIPWLHASISRVHMNSVSLVLSNYCIYTYAHTCGTSPHDNWWTIPTCITCTIYLYRLVVPLEAFQNSFHCVLIERVESCTACRARRPGSHAYISTQQPSAAALN